MIFNNYYRLCIILFTDFKDPHPTSHVHINNNPTKTKKKIQNNNMIQFTFYYNIFWTLFLV